MNSAQNDGTPLTKEKELSNRIAHSLERMQRIAIPPGMSRFLQQQATIMQQINSTQRISETALRSSLTPLLQQMTELKAFTGPVISVPAENYTVISRTLEVAAEFEPELKKLEIDAPDKELDKTEKHLFSDVQKDRLLAFLYFLINLLVTIWLSKPGPADTSRLSDELHQEIADNLKSLVDTVESLENQMDVLFDSTHSDGHQQDVNQ